MSSRINAQDFLLISPKPISAYTASLPTAVIIDSFSWAISAIFLRVSSSLWLGPGRKGKGKRYNLIEGYGIVFKGRIQ